MKIAVQKNHLGGQILYRSLGSSFFWGFLASFTYSIFSHFSFDFLGLLLLRGRIFQLSKSIKATNEATLSFSNWFLVFLLNSKCWKLFSKTARKWMFKRPNFILIQLPCRILFVFCERWLDFIILAVCYRRVRIRGQSPRMTFTKRIFQLWISRFDFQFRIWSLNIEFLFRFSFSSFEISISSFDVPRYTYPLYWIMLPTLQNSLDILGWKIGESDVQYLVDRRVEK